jgi:glycosidase
MKQFIKISAFVCIFTTACNIYGQDIQDIINPIKVSIGKNDTVLVSDLFYAKDYPVTFEKSDCLTLTFDKQHNLIAVGALNNFQGFTLLKFSMNEKKYAVPVEIRSAVQSLIPHTFTYKPDGKVSNVAVFGSFNNWNRNANPMSLVNGKYETVLNLEPGSYVYKLIVDGKEILDPSNAETAPTGFENFNSVIRITDPNPVKVFLFSDALKAGASVSTFSFLLEKNGKAANCAKENVYALLNNEVIPTSDITVTGNKIEIKVAKNKLSGDKLLRVAATIDAKASNLQSVYLNNGKPVQAHHPKFAWEDGIIYSIMIDRFNDGDKSNSIPVVHDSLFPQANYQGGDFQGIINKIDDGYFDKLGINVLWISPVYDNPNDAYRESPAPHRWYSGYHGYWPISSNNVEEKFGTFSKLQELVDKAHKHNIKVLLDIVAHHVHIEHPYYKNHPEWFGKLELPDGRKNLRLWDEYRLTTWFEPYMPSFDYTSSKEAIDTMSANCVWWLKQTHADGFRHDAVKHVPNLFWRALTRKLKEEIEVPDHKKVYQIGETFGDNDLIASYVNNGQLSAQFNFNLSYLAIPVFLESDKSFQTLDYYMDKAFAAFGYNHIMGNIMDSHDKVRFMAYADGKVGKQGVDTREMAWNNPPTVDNPSSYDKAKLFYAFMFTTPGLPTIYYGSEFGMTGADDPDNRRMMRFGDALSVNEKRLLNETRQIVKLRNTHSALRYGDFYTLQADNKTYSYMRGDYNERLIVVLNKSDETAPVALSIPQSVSVKSLVDVVNGEKISVKDNAVTITAPKIGYRIFKVVK